MCANAGHILPTVNENQTPLLVVKQSSIAGLIGSLSLLTHVLPVSAQSAPAVLTGPASDIVAVEAGANATLNMTIDANGLSTTVWFEWGAGSLYWHRTPITSVPAGAIAVPVRHSLTGLVAGVLYHYSAAASNSMGVARGGDVRFWSPRVTAVGDKSLTNECHSDLPSSAYLFSAGSAYASISGAHPAIVVSGQQGNGLGAHADGSVSGWGTSDVSGAATNVIAVSEGVLHSLALRADGTAVGWGRSIEGQINPPTGATNLIAIAVGDLHSLALRADGVVFAFGAGGTANPLDPPRHVEQSIVPQSATNVVAISAGAFSSLALRADGTVVGWGLKLGLDIPADATNLVSITSGALHNLGLKADGTVVGWGITNNGNIQIPSNATDVVAIAAGAYHSLALRSDGTVVAWGRNDSGQTDVPNAATNVVAITGGDSYSLAMRDDGTLIGWGSLSLFPDWTTNVSLDLDITGAVNSNVSGLYQIVATATNGLGALGRATRSVLVSDTTSPTLNLLGANPLFWTRGTSFNDPGATANDTCASNLTSSIIVSGIVNTNLPGSYTLIYTVTDPGGNSATTNRTVLVVAAPSISKLSAAAAGTELATGSPRAQFDATFNPYGLSTSTRFEYGLDSNYPGVVGLPNLPSSFADTNLSATSLGLIPGITYHWRAVASNELGLTYSPDQIFIAPLVFAAGDLNGDGLVSQGELDQILTNYWPTSPWIYLTNVAGLGESNVTFELSNATVGTFSVLMSTNLMDWDFLGPAMPRYELADTNAPAVQRYYRLRWP